MSPAASPSLSSFSRFCLLLLCAMSSLPLAAQDAGKDAYGAMAGKKFGELKSLTDALPIKYIRPDIPTAKIPEAQGEYEEALIPDTLDLSERARLFVDNYLGETTVPELDYEPRDRGAFEQDPPRLFISIGSYQCALPKYRESLPLLRLISGSKNNLAIDKAWGENILKCIGPDGLYYIPLVGRPWEQAGAYEWWKEIQSDYYTNLWTCNGRLLGSLAIYYQMTGDEVWKETGKGVVDALNKLAVRVGDEAFFPKFLWTPGEKLTEAEIAEAKKNMPSPTVSESEKNTPLWQTWIITGLCQFYRATNYEPARDLAKGLINYQRKAKYVENFASHFHCISLGIQALTEYAEASGDMQYAREAEAAYQYVVSGKNMTAFPEIGYFVNGKGPHFMEGCSIADMTAISTRLARLGFGDKYWEDADRYVRNMLAESQFTNAGQIDTFTRHLKANCKTSNTVLQYNHLADRLSERMVGAFNLHFNANNLFGVTYFDPCCSGNLSRALYYVWQNIVEMKDRTLDIRFLLNRTSPWVDIDSYIPYQGRVDFRFKQPIEKVRIRLNDWIKRDAIKCSEDGRPLEFKLEDNYLVLSNVQPTNIRIEFPIEETVKQLDSFGEKYEAVFRGNECVDLNPKGADWALFQRANYRTGVPRYLKVSRFVCENPIVH